MQATRPRPPRSLGSDGSPGTDPTNKTVDGVTNALPPELQGNIDAMAAKSYVLGMLFYRFISENLTAFINEDERAAGQTDFDYRRLSDDAAEIARKDTVNEKGFFILPSELFDRNSTWPR